MALDRLDNANSSLDTFIKRHPLPSDSTKPSTRWGLPLANYCTCFWQRLISINTPALKRDQRALRYCLSGEKYVIKCGSPRSHIGRVISAFYTLSFVTIKFQYGTLGPNHYVNHYLSPARQAAKEASKLPSLYVLRPFFTFSCRQGRKSQPSFTSRRSTTKRVNAQRSPGTIYSGSGSYYSCDSTPWGDPREGRIGFFYRPKGIVC